MSGIFFDAAGMPTEFARSEIDASPARNEKWLQKTLFDHPELLPLEEIDPAARGFLPICRELALTGARSSVFLDIFGVSRSGKLVLVECKLWRNPEARREVIGQILEYASILCQRTYSDLEALLKAKPEWTGRNPLYQRALQRWPDLSERSFVEGVERSLSQADFSLIIAGDGIRTDAQAIARLLEQRGGIAARVGLVEVRTWTGPLGELFVSASVAARTDVATTRVLVGSDDRPLAVVSVDESETPDAAAPTEQSPQQKEKRIQNKMFWETFVSMVKFDHPDQDPNARVGVNNFVWFPFVDPIKRLTVYRSETSGSMGVFFKVSGAACDLIIEELKAISEDLESEIHSKVEFTDNSKSADSSWTVGVYREVDVSDKSTLEFQLEWLSTTVNRFVSAFRPRLGRILQVNQNG